MNKLKGSYLGSLIFLVTLDQFLKFLALSNIKSGQSIPLINNIIHITLVRNTGAAFGMFKEKTLFFIAMSIAAIIFIMIYENSPHKAHRYIRLGLFLILSGTIGNLIDRLRFGYVVDYIDLRIWPVFNFADILLTTGGALIAYEMIILPIIEKIMIKKA